MKPVPVTIYDGTNTTTVNRINAPAGSVDPNGVLDLGVGVKVYRALLTQTGTDDPVATVLENTLGEVPIFIAVGTGSMTCSVLGELFVANKTFVSIEGIRFGSISPEDAIFASVILAGLTQLEISTAVCSNGGGGLWGVPVATDGVLSNHGIEILVYP